MCYSLWYNAPTMLPARGCIIPQAVTLLVTQLVKECLAFVEFKGSLRVSKIRPSGRVPSHLNPVDNLILFI